MIASLFRLQAAQLGHVWRVESLVMDTDDNPKGPFRSSCTCVDEWVESEKPLRTDPEGSYRRWEIHVIEAVGETQIVEAIVSG